MTDIRAWLDDGSVSGERARRALPILVGQARSEQPITYEALAEELGMSHHRPVRFVAGHVGYTLQGIGQLRGWKGRRPPPLQSLVINKNTRIPGSGVNEFMTVAFRRARTKKQKQAALAGIYAEIYSYPYWEEVLDLLGLDPAPAASDEAIEDARNASGRGGEGPEHLALKKFVAKRPDLVGLRLTHPDGECEYRLPSGDSVDVVFATRGHKLAVEVKSHLSSDGDVARGLFQCVKYRAVLEAESGTSSAPFDSDAVLVLGRSLPRSLWRLRNSLALRVIENIRAPGDAS